MVQVKVATAIDIKRILAIKYTQTFDGYLSLEICEVQSLADFATTTSTWHDNVSYFPLFSCEEAVKTFAYLSQQDDLCEQCDISDSYLLGLAMALKGDPALYDTMYANMFYMIDGGFTSLQNYGKKSPDWCGWTNFLLPQEGWFTDPEVFKECYKVADKKGGK